MKTVIIVSKCTRVIKANHSEMHYHFHFKGVWGGEFVKKVILKGVNEWPLQKGEEYLMWVAPTSYSEGVLNGQILKVKNLDQCNDRS